MKITTLVKKNLKIIMRSKTSSLIVIFGPLLIILLVGLAFDNSSLYNINIGVYSDKYSPLTEEFINNLNVNEMKTTKMSSEDYCLSEIKQGRTHVCIIFPPDMQVSNERTNEIMFYVDYSKINLVYPILDVITERVSRTTTDVSFNLTSVLLSKLQETQAELHNRKNLLIDLTTENTNIKSNLEQISKDLVAMDLKFEGEDLDFDALKQKTDFLKDQGTKAIDRALSILDFVDEKAGTMLISDDENSPTLSSVVTDVIIDLNQIKDAINGQYNAERTDSVDSIFERVQTNIGLIQARLEKADKDRTVLVARIGEVNNIVDSSLAHILALQNSLNKINQNINSIQVTSAAQIVNPISTTIKPIVPEKTHLNYIFPSLIVLIVMFISVILSSTIVVMEKSSDSYFRNLITPTPDSIQFLAVYFTNLIIVMVQVFIILAIASLFFKTEIFHAFWPLMLGMLLIVTFFTLFGILIGFIFHSEETVTIAGVSISSVMLLLSGLILPLENMPESFVTLANLNPFVVSEALLKKILLFTTGLQGTGVEIKTLILYSLIMIILILVVYKMARKNVLLHSFKRLIPLKDKLKHLSFKRTTAKVSEDDDMVLALDDPTTQKKVEGDEASELLAKAKQAHEKKDMAVATALYEKLHKMYKDMPAGEKKNQMYKDLLKLHQDLTKKK